MNSQRLRKLGALCATALSFFCSSSLSTAQPVASTPTTATAVVAATKQNIVALEQDIAALRESLRRTEGYTGDTATARRVIDTEALLLKERQLVERRIKLHEQQPDAEDLARRDLQKNLNEAKDEDERAALRARHQAYQRVLAAEAAQARRAARRVSVPATTSTDSAK